MANAIPVVERAFVCLACIQVIQSGMSKSAIITARIDEETLELVDRVSKARGRSRAWFAARVIEQVARSEAEFLAFIQEGIDDIEADRIVEHEEVVAELDAMIAHAEERDQGARHA